MNCKAIFISIFISTSKIISANFKPQNFTYLFKISITFSSQDISQLFNMLIYITFLNKKIKWKFEASLKKHYKTLNINHNNSQKIFLNYWQASTNRDKQVSRRGQLRTNHLVNYDGFSKKATFCEILKCPFLWKLIINLVKRRLF